MPCSIYASATPESALGAAPALAAPCALAVLPRPRARWRLHASFIIFCVPVQHLLREQTRCQQNRWKGQMRDGWRRKGVQVGARDDLWRNLPGDVRRSRGSVPHGSSVRQLWHLEQQGGDQRRQVTLRSGSLRVDARKNHRFASVDATRPAPTDAAAACWVS